MAAPGWCFGGSWCPGGLPRGLGSGVAMLLLFAFKANRLFVCNKCQKLRSQFPRGLAGD